LTPLPAQENEILLMSNTHHTLTVTWHTCVFDKILHQKYAL